MKIVPFYLQIAGLETNINFLLNLSRHPEFSAGNVHTNFIKDHNTSLLFEIKPREIQLLQACLAIILKDEIDETAQAASRNDQYNPFIVESNFRINQEHRRNIKLRFEDEGIEYTLNNKNLLYTVVCRIFSECKIFKARWIQHVT